MSSEGLEREEEIERAIETLVKHQEPIDELIDAVEKLERSRTLDPLRVAGTRDGLDNELFYETFADYQVTSGRSRI